MTQVNDIAVKVMQASDKARWDAFVEQCPSATFFHRAGCRRYSPAKSGVQQ